jgi:hypothetical protein
MKFINLVLIFAFITLEIIFGQKEELVRPRHYFQQNFIIEEFQLNNKKLVISDTLKVDSIFTRIQKSWESFVRDSLINNKSNLSVQILNNLDAYSYYFTLKSLAVQNYLNNEIEYYLFKNYMLPSLIKDYQFIKTNPSLNNLKLIWAGSLSNTLMYGAKYYDNSETSKSFYELFKNLRALLQRLENSDNASKSYATQLLNYVSENEYEIETKQYFLIISKI